MSGIDWLIISLYAVTIAAIGGYANRSVGSLSDFIVAGRNVKLSLNIATLTSTELAIVTAMALAEMGFRYGFAAMVLGLCFFMGVTTIGLSGFVIERLRKCQVMTIPEFYGLRYNQLTRWLGGLVLSAAGILNMGFFLKISAIFLAYMTGLSMTEVGKIMAVVLIVVLSYTLLGGRLSVVVTNYFQFAFIVIGAIIATYFAIASVGFEKMITVVKTHYGTAGENPFVNEDMGWSFILMNTLVFFALPLVWQPSSACTLSAQNPQIARRTIFWSGLTFMGRGTIPILWGIAALAYFDGQSGALFEMKPIEAMPAFFAQILPIGIIGCFVAAMLATDMSTYNGYLLAWSSIITQDVLFPLIGSSWNERKLLLVNRMIIVLIGVFLLWWGLLYEPPASFFQYQQVTGTIYLSGALTCVVGGLYWKPSNSVGAIAAISVGTLFPIINVLLQPWIIHLPKCLQFLKNGWQAGLTAYFLALGAFVLGSLVTRKNGKGKASLVNQIINRSYSSIDSNMLH